MYIPNRQVAPTNCITLNFLYAEFRVILGKTLNKLRDSDTQDIIKAVSERTNFVMALSAYYFDT